MAQGSEPIPSHAAESEHGFQRRENGDTWVSGCFRYCYHIPRRGLVVRGQRSTATASHLTRRIRCISSHGGFGTLPNPRLCHFLCKCIRALFGQCLDTTSTCLWMSHDVLCAMVNGHPMPSVVCHCCPLFRQLSRILATIIWLLVRSVYHPSILVSYLASRHATDC